MKYAIEKLLISALFGGLYLVMIKLSWTLDLVQGYAPGISLVFLPAGIKLVAALVSGFWGVLGTVVALACVAPDIWPDQPTWFYVVYPALGGFSSLAVVHIMKRALGIDDDLRNLRLTHIPLIDLCATLVHGVVLNSFFYLYHLHLDQDFWTRVLAMSVGDFFGSLIMLLGFSVLTRLYQAYRPRLLKL